MEISDKWSITEASLVDGDFRLTVNAVNGFIGLRQVERKYQYRLLLNNVLMLINTKNTLEEAQAAGEEALEQMKKERGTGGL